MLKAGRDFRAVSLEYTAALDRHPVDGLPNLCECGGSGCRKCRGTGLCQCRDCRKVTSGGGN